MKLKYQIYLTSFLTIAVVILLDRSTSVNCFQVYVFKEFELAQIWRFFGNIFFGIVVWVIGYQVSKKLKLKRIQLLAYFIALSLLSTNRIIRNIGQNYFSTSREIVQAICKKSEDNGTVYEAHNLTSEEYNYLVDGSQWIPKAPPRAENIEIYYYRDDFLGDFTLDIQIEMSNNEEIDSLKYPKWEVSENDKYYFGGYQD